jgi:hypothetical protein
LQLVLQFKQLRLQQPLRQQRQQQQVLARHHLLLAAAVTQVFLAVVKVEQYDAVVQHQNQSLRRQRQNLRQNPRRQLKSPVEYAVSV